MGAHGASRFHMDGNRTDDFDKFLKREVEDPAAPELKKLAKEKVLDDPNKRPAVALFIALTAARSPQFMNNVKVKYRDNLSRADHIELEDMVKQWCDWTKQPYNSNSESEFMKPSSFGAIWTWSKNLQNRLLKWEWHLIRTTRDHPFVTSDWPVFAQWRSIMV